MQVALRNRPVELAQIEEAADKITKILESQGDAEIQSEKIGALVMKALIELDVVGYIRFASVYKDFRNPEDFNEFLNDVQGLNLKSKKSTATKKTS